jgi:hypothetical protein
MDRATAEQVEKIMADVIRQLDESVALVQTKCGPEEFHRYRRTVGKVMGEIFLDIQQPLYNQHPELTPPGLRRD